MAELELDKLILEVDLTTSRLHQAVSQTRQKVATSERRTCTAAGLARSSMKYHAVGKNDDGLQFSMIRLARTYGRYGCRKKAEQLRTEGWQVNRKKVGRLWRLEGLQLPGRLDHRMLTILDEDAGQALAVTVRIRMGSEEGLEVLNGLFLRHGKPGSVRSGTGPEHASWASAAWLDKVGVNLIRVYPAFCALIATGLLLRRCPNHQSELPSRHPDHCPD